MLKLERKPLCRGTGQAHAQVAHEACGGWLAQSGSQGGSHALHELQCTVVQASEDLGEEQDDLGAMPVRAAVVAEGLGDVPGACGMGVPGLPTCGWPRTPATKRSAVPANPMVAARSHCSLVMLSTNGDPVLMSATSWWPPWPWPSMWRSGL